MLAAGCRDLGIDFVDLEASSFYGWAFVDRVHMTDYGYDQVARAISEAISK